ncbi:SDR family oxidoreductase, partial [Candidatus Gracilibacteria bacterium]|nr:SDR family oxidoreductase [Candidatus Gracilibacteria bacterium]
MKRILVTGATGFIGQHLVQELVNNNFEVAVTIRKKNNLFSSTVTQFIVKDIESDPDWTAVLQDIECVIHLAGRAHVLKDKNPDPLTEFRRVNTDGTINLAHQAIKLGIKRFIFISSIGVNGNVNNKPFSVNDIPNPIEPYAVSKYEAEFELQKLTNGSKMETVIIRPPLVYGPNAPGNFAQLIKVTNKGIPLPLGEIHNQRSFIAIENLIDLIITCIKHPAAANKTFLASDDEDLSTTDLLRRMAIALEKPSRLIPIPPSIITLGATLLGKKEIAQRLCGSLQVDINHTKKTLDWKPPVSVDEALKKTADAF